MPRPESKSLPPEPLDTNIDELADFDEEYTEEPTEEWVPLEPRELDTDEPESEG